MTNMKVIALIISLILFIPSVSMATDFKDWVNSLTANTGPLSTDLIYVLVDPAGTPLSRKVAFSNLLKGISSITIGNASSTFTLTGDVTGTDTSLVWGDNTLTYNGGFIITMASDVPHLYLDHTGEASAQSIIEFRDDGTYKYALVYDMSGNGTANFGIYDAEDVAWRLTIDDDGVVNVPVGVTSASVVLTGKVAAGGIVSGKIGIVTKTSAYTLGTDDSNEAYGYAVFLTNATTLTLPSAVAGMSFCVYSTDANVKTIEPNGSDVITLDGAALTAGHNITSDGAAGDFICMISQAANNWVSFGSGKTAWNDGA